LNSGAVLDWSRWKRPSSTMDEILPKPLTDVPLLQGMEQRLVLMRMNLMDSVAHLKIAHDAAVVCIAASKQTNADCNAEVASVLFNMVNHRIDEQMRVIRLHCQAVRRSELLYRRP
jgi:hypothetical protein